MWALDDAAGGSLFAFFVCNSFSWAWRKEDFEQGHRECLSRRNPPPSVLLKTTSSPPPHLSVLAGIHNSHSSARRTMGVVVAMARHLDALIGPVVMLLYPLYASMRAIESPSPVDDQQWLTYWVLYSLITLFELSCWKMLQWFPLWPYMKLVFCFWLVLPMFNGAAYIYESHVRRYVKLGGAVSSGYSDRQRRVMQVLSLDARKAVDRFVEVRGQEAFDRVVKAAEREARSRPLK